FAATVTLYLLRKSYSRWAVYLAAFAAGLFLHSVVSQTVPKDDISLHLSGYKPVEAEVTGVVGSDPERREDSTVFNLNVETVSCADYDGEAAGNCRVTIYRNTPLDYGDRVKLSGVLSRPTPARFPNGFDNGKYLKARGVNTILKINDDTGVSPIGKGPTSPVYWLSYKIKGYVARSIEENIGGRAAAFIKGLLLGSRGEIDYDIQDDFKAAGVFHILAVSGQHVNLLALLFFLVLSAFKIPKRYAAVLVMLFLPIFAIITGMSPPVIRAAIMGEMVLLAVFVERDVDLFNILAAAAILILAFNPLLINDISFTLSYSASIGIALGYRPTRDWLARRRVPPFLRETLAATFAAQLGVTPLQMWYFHRLTPVSFLSNLVIVPASALTMVFGLLTAAMNVFIPPLAKFYGAAAFAVSELIFIITDVLASGLSFMEPLLSGLPPSILNNLDLQFWVGRPSILVMIIVWTIPILLFVKHTYMRKITVFASLALVTASVWAAVLFPRKPDMEITFLPVGNADSCIIITPNRKVILVDTGNSFNDYSAGRSAIEPYLHSRGIDRIDVMCITHTDRDHIGGAEYLMREMPLGEVWLRADDDKEINKRLRDLAGERYVEVVEISPEKCEIDGVALNRLWPPDDIDDLPGYAENDRSTVFMVRYGGFRALLTGDAGRKPQKELLNADVPLTAHLLKAPHHGAYKDSDSEFVRAVMPYFGAITCRYGADGRSPDLATIEMLEAFGCYVADTGRNGAVTVMTDGDKVKLRTAY
ncbi:MAG: DNA internalization-related competence protein ComEC/Rec2, partial [bacterium]|nr:DNA internalization-related competence protein ComEC/Rec2 [bacterium]